MSSSSTSLPRTRCGGIVVSRQRAIERAERGPALARKLRVVLRPNRRALAAKAR